MKSFRKKTRNCLQGHLNWVQTVAVTKDNKYIVSGSYDKTIRIWNLLEKKQKAFLNFDFPVKSVEVDTEYNLTIYLDSGEIKTLDIKEFI
jgi:WD domain, G-beta repeat.